MILTHIEPVTGDHLLYVAEHIRPDDAEEIKALSDLPPDRGLVECVRGSHVCYAAMAEDIPVFLYGARNVGEGIGIVWMMATPKLSEVSVSFLRRSSGYIDMLYDEVDCDTLANIVDKRNTLHIKWLKWAGFTFGDEVNAGPYNMPFYEIAKTRD